MKSDDDVIENCSGLAPAVVHPLFEELSFVLSEIEYGCRQQVLRLLAQSRILIHRYVAEWLAVVSDHRSMGAYLLDLSYELLNGPRKASDAPQ